jgi:Domain of unknown function (DUF4276)
MELLRYTLITDGSSDKTLMNIIKWLLDDLYPKISNRGTFGDFRYLQKPPKKGDIKNQIQCAEYFYPFDILFYHRDAESDKKSIVKERTEEIKSQLEEKYISKTICIIPIKMMENWLLIDETAIKKAAGNRNYSKQINLPQINKIESLNEPKLFLHDLLKEVSGKKSRQLKNFNVQQAVHLVAENISDYSLLRNLDSFKQFEENLKTTISNLLK